MSEEKRITKTEKPRIQELDLLKALAIIAMIICHCVEVLGEHRIGFESDYLYFFGLSAWCLHDFSKGRKTRENSTRTSCVSPGRLP